MAEQNELDSTCGVSDDELTAEQEAERQRAYSESDVEWIKFIRCLKETGMHLKKIHRYSELRYIGNETMSARLKILRMHRKYVLAQKLKWNEYLQNLDSKIVFYEKSINSEK